MFGGLCLLNSTNYWHLYLHINILRVNRSNFLHMSYVKNVFCSPIFAYYSAEQLVCWTCKQRCLCMLCGEVATCCVSLEWVFNNTVHLFMRSDDYSFTQVLEYLKKDKNCNFQDKYKTRKYCKMCIFLHGHMHNSTTVNFNLYAVHSIRPY